MRRLPKRPSSLSQFDRFPSNRKTTALVLLIVCTAWLVWSRVYIDSDVKRVAQSRDNRFPIDAQPAGLYETWNSTDDFGASHEYLAFIGANNVNFSQHISDEQLIERSLPDTRHLFCILRQYPRRVPIERFSIIVTFDETVIRSALIRTIISVLRRTPAPNLGEIILINDAKTTDEDNDTSTSFLQRMHHKIRYIRNAKHLGAMRSRQLAATEYAQFKYLLFLDEHSEVNIGWLPPLLYRLQANPNGAALISPALDEIDTKTWQYRSGEHWMRTGFDWRLRPQRFQRAPESWEGNWRGRNETFPFLSPTTGGRTFAVSREWFTRIGGFEGTLLPTTGDGDTIELSLRAWMCGGHVEIMPCSRVGRLLAEERNVSVDDSHTNISNARRIAETWLGNYRPLFYENTPEAATLPIALPRSAWMKQRHLQCYPFRWYLETVFPELSLRSQKYGALGELLQSNRCARPNRDQSVALIACQPSGIPTTTWTLHRSGHITLYNQTDLCLGAIGNAVRMLSNCDRRTNRWTYNANNTLVHLESRQCLDTLDGRVFASGILLVLQECDLRTRRSQIWHFTVKLN